MPTCGAQETLCGSADAGLTCANVMTDPRNCGVCGRACDTDRVCSSGVCTFMCRTGLTECSRPDGDGGTVRACADVRTDARNCGACGNSCMDGYACDNGVCRLRCPELRTACPRPMADAGSTGGGEFCTNLGSDIENCGACGMRCPFGQLCSGGTCATMCGAGLTNCNSVCSNVQTDRENCGACGNACAAGQVCTAGRCVTNCGAGLTDCMGACRDLSNDNANCGACGTTCPGGQVCSGGMCRVSCAGGSTNCAGTCRDLATDTANCGMCNRACPAGQICSGGMCQVSSTQAPRTAAARAATSTPTASTAGPAA
ncbi:MAG: MXAN_6577-like cysteine-rich protein [Polyangiales bacterium]